MAQQSKALPIRLRTRPRTLWTTPASTAKGAENAGDALTLTPKVKAAIVANEKLNNTNNVINVDTKDNIVHLKGHVTSNDMKKLAGEVAEKAVKDSGSSDTVRNELTVASH